jgi:hypothetical protein
MEVEMDKPLFVETSEGYVINLALVRWISINDRTGEVDFHFAEGRDPIGIVQSEWLKIKGKIAHLIL